LENFSQKYGYSDVFYGEVDHCVIYSQSEIIVKYNTNATVYETFYVDVSLAVTLRLTDIVGC